MPERETQCLRADDGALAAMSREGDMQAFEELVFRYEKKLVATAYRLCGNVQEGEDLAQEAFIKAWRAITGYRGQASFRTWMTAILTNLWRDRLRKAGISLTPESLDAQIEGEEGSISKQFGDTGPGPEDIAEKKEIRGILGAMIQELHPVYKEALVLRDVQGFSYEEVAEITGSNPGTVKSRINRARTQMKAKILEFQEHYPDFFRLEKTERDKRPGEKVKGGESDEG